MNTILSTSHFARLWRWAILAGAAASALPSYAQGGGANQLIVFYKTGSMPIQGYQPCGLLELDRSGSAVLYAADGSAHAAEAMRAAGASPRVAEICPNEWIAIQPRQFVPNDPLYAPASGHPGQWSLANVLNMPHANLVPAWLSGATGQGVNIGIIDDGLDYTHPDLRPNYNPLLSFDYAENDANPMPRTGDLHGTMMAGVAAARGGNAIGLSGVAPMAGLVGIRIGRSQPTNMWRVVKAMQHQADAVTIKVHGYGLNNSSGAAQPYMGFASASTAQSDTAALGVIHVRSAGNERGKVTEDANKWDLENDPSAICVGAVGSDGKFAPYSSFGANLLVTAPGGLSSGPYRITSTSTQGGGNLGGVYTNQFYGTSASAALVAGVLALGKEVRPDMDVRMAKHLLVLTSKRIDSGDATPSSDGGWRENGAGSPFNPNYGHGLVDAAAFVELARSAAELSELETESIFGTPNVSIPDNSANGIQQRFAIESETPLEDVVVKLKFTHQRRGDLEAYLTSPSGFRSRIFATSTSDNQANMNWTFTSTAFWGENPAGEWTLTVCDRRVQKTGKLNRFDVTMRMGTLDVSAGPEAPSDLVATPYIDKVDLDWIDNSEDEDGFTVYISEDGVDYDFAAEVEEDETVCTVDGLRPDKAYWFIVKAHNGEGESNPSNVAETRTLELPAPIITVDETTVRTLSCSWSFDSEADHFEVQCLELGDPEETEDYNDVYTELAPDSTYTVRVRAIVGEGEEAYTSPWSESVQGTTLPIPAPEDLEATPSATSIEATWSEVGECDGYEVQLDEDDVEDATETSHLFEYLAPETEYSVKVRAFIEIDDARVVSEWAEINVSTLSLEPPSNLEVLAITPRSILIGFNAPDGADSYTLSLNGDEFEIDGSPYLIEDLEPETEYAMQVNAIYGEYTSEWSNEIVATTLSEQVSPPSNLRRDGVSDTSVQLMWQDNSNNETKFRIAMSRDNSNFENAGEVGANVTSFTVIGLRPATTYYFKVRGGNDYINSAYSNTLTVRTKPATPADFRVTGIGRYYVDFSWRHGDDPRRFEIWQSINGGGWHKGEDVPGGARAARRNPLEPSTDYRFRMRSIDHDETPSAWSGEVSVRTPDVPPSPPNTPGTPWVNNIGSRQLDLHWSDGSSNETGFQIFMSTGGDYQHIASTAANDTGFRVTGLQPGTGYWFKVRAVNAVGASDLSDRVYALTDGEAPATPTNLRVVDRGRDWIKLAWDHPGGAEKFFIQDRRNDSSGWTDWGQTGREDVPGNVRIATRSPLTPNKLYRFRIRAENSRGVSDWSNVVEVRTRQ